MLSLLFALIDRFLLPARAAARAGWLREAIYAHRGLHGPGVPENSLAAAEAAIARGFGIECDVQRSRDGQVVVFHDRALDRLTGQAGNLADHTAAELAGMTLLDETGMVVGGETILGLRQLLDRIDGRVPLLIEVKSAPTQRIAPLCLAVRRLLEGYRGPVAVMSFDPRVAAWFRRYSPHVVHGLVVTEAGRRTLLARLKRHLALWRARPQFLAYDIADIANPVVRLARRRGVPVLTWTVRTPDDASRAATYADAPIAEGPVLLAAPAA
ncbi:glycerophosphoryl diester phosphodiesterase [Novosphingobium sp. 1529]|uniref:glycerophosphodiester phosphodiesterase family protein n=1 Tax=unclassified Novosphingobium TaxID=2644732 RepID=UPI000684B6FC|nr:MULTISPECIES: glycerophosphodiester phosphodiesterase family protein [unclassified Novosphingobium]KPF52556.1 glycerophosphodiester phosphodiesterase [Novosphingobium sp. AAP1]